MNSICLRITSSEQKKIEQFIRSRAHEHWFIAFEEGAKTQKPHAHCWYDTIKQVQTERVAVSKLFGKGNENFSISTTRKTLDVYIGYCLKDNNYIKSENFPEELFEAAKQRAKQNKLTVYQKLEYSLLSKDQEITSLLIVDTVLAFYEAEQKLFNHRQISLYCKALSYKYRPAYTQAVRASLIDDISISALHNYLCKCPDCIPCQL